MTGPGTVSDPLDSWDGNSAQSRDRFARFAEALPQAIWTMDPSLNVRYRNPAFRKQFGISWPDGSRWTDAIHPDDIPAFVAAHRLGASRNETYEHRCRLRTQAGTFAPFSLTIVPQLGDNGRLAEWSGVLSQDVVVEIPMAPTEARVRENETRLLLALDTGRMGSWEVRLDDLRILSSTIAREHIGVPVDREPTLAEILSVLDERDRITIQESLRTLLDSSAAHGDYDFPLRVNPLNEASRWLHLRGKVDRDSNGRGIRVVGVSLDVTAQREAVRELRQQEREFRRLAEALPTIVVVLDAAGHLLFFNQRCSEYCGVPHSDFGLSQWRDAIHPDDFQNLDRAWKKALRTGLPFVAQYRLRRADGVYRWHLERSVPVFDGEDRVHKWFATVTDFHDVKQAQRRAETSEARLRAVIDNCPLIVWSLDEGGRYTMSEGRGLASFNYRPNEVVGRHHSDVHGKYPDMVEHAERALRGEASSTETEFPGGQWFQTHFAPLRGEHGETRGMVGVSTDITERKRFEKAIADSEAKFRRLFDLNVVGMFFFDIDGGVSTANRCYLNIIGYDAHDLENGKVRWNDLTPPEWLASDASALQQLMQSGACRPYEKEYIRKDGSRVPVIIVGALLEGSSTQGIAVALDVSAQKRTFAALEESESRFRLVEDEAQVGLWEWHFGSESAFFSPGCWRIVGRTSENLSSSIDEWFNLMHPDDRREAMQSLHNTWTDARNDFRADFRWKHSDGSWRWVLCRGLVFRDEFGQPQKMLGINVDVTEKRRAVDALEESREALRHNDERFRVAERGAGTGSWSWDVSGTTFHFSPGYRLMLGYEENEPFPNTRDGWTNELVHPDDQKRLWESAEDSVKNGTLYACEFRLKHKRGDWRWILSRAIVERDPAGNPTRMVGVHIDITAQKELVRELQRLTSELRGSNAELERFAYVASHDLKEPIRNVATYLQLFLRANNDRLDPKGFEYVNGALDGAKRMIGIVDGLMRFFRIGAANRSISFAESEDVLAAALGALRQSITESGADIHVDPLPKIRCDREQLTQVFQNLLSNALKFRRPSVRPEIRISAQREGKTWIFSVQDNGIGIPKDKADQVFEVFKRLHRREEYPGEGIGLALCKRVIEAHSGSIWVEAGVGGGSIFYFSLPA